MALFYGSGNDFFCFEWSPGGYRVRYEVKDIWTIKDFLGQCVPHLVRCMHESACVVRLDTGDLLLVRQGSNINALHIQNVVRTDARGVHGEPVVRYVQHRFFPEDAFMDSQIAPAMRLFSFTSEPTAHVTNIMASARRVAGIY
jgi:hypothetical protein